MHQFYFIFPQKLVEEKLNITGFEDCVVELSVNRIIDIEKVESCVSDFIFNSPLTECEACQKGRFAAAEKQAFCQLCEPGECMQSIQKKGPLPD